MASKRTEEARERLLGAANELFYAEGVHTVGIDRVIDHAGVAKATLYSVFGSKDELIRAYLDRRHQGWHERIEEKLAMTLCVLDLCGVHAADPRALVVGEPPRR